MQYRTIGDVAVSAIGLGGMPMSIEGRPDRARSVATIHAALDAGITLIDTADAYSLGGPEVGHNEELIAEALGSYGGDASGVLVATKGGHLRPGDGTWTINGDPAYLIEAARASVRRLGVDAIGLYQHHRPDPSVPYEDSIGALKTLLDSGTIRMAGISNASVAQIKIAQGILGDALVSVQNHFSPVFLSTRDTLDYCAEQGLAFLPWSPLGGIGHGAALSDNAVIAELAAGHGVSPQRVVLAWELSLAPVVIPIPGASRPESIVDDAAAAELVLTTDEQERIAASLA